VVSFAGPRRGIVKRWVRRGANALAAPIKRASRHYFGVITGVSTERPVLALTFDDGPHPDYTPAVLDVLAKYDARATFFMIGANAARHPEVVRAAVQAGHVLGNHSWSHVSFPLMTAKERCAELRRCEEVLVPDGAKLFRPPYCHQSLGSRWDTLRAGYEVIGFTVHAEDWLVRPVDWMREKLVRQARPGAIVILHDRIYHSVLPEAEPDRRPMLRALDQALGELRDQFRFVTVPELLRQGSPIRENWFQKGPQTMQPMLQSFLRDQRRREKLQSVST
jgi:peptidoglycan-N-acetylglucosamine deacetylase